MRSLNEFHSSSFFSARCPCLAQVPAPACGDQSPLPPLIALVSDVWSLPPLPGQLGPVWTLSPGVPRPRPLLSKLRKYKWKYSSLTESRLFLSWIKGACSGVIIILLFKVFEMAGSVGEQTATVTTLSQPGEPTSGDHWRVETEDAHGWLTHVIIIVILMNQCHRWPSFLVSAFIRRCKAKSLCRKRSTRNWTVRRFF